MMFLVLIFHWISLGLLGRVSYFTIPLEGSFSRVRTNLIGVIVNQQRVAAVLTIFRLKVSLLWWAGVGLVRIGLPRVTRMEGYLRVFATLRTTTWEGDRLYFV